MEHTETTRSINRAGKNGPSQVDDSPLPLLVAKLEQIEGELEIVAARRDEIKTAIAKRVAPMVAEARSLLQKTEGTVHAAVEGCDVESVVPKDIKWDSSILMSAAEKIAEAGEDPQRYIDFKATVSERKYDVLPDFVKRLVDPARTLKHGKERISVTVAEAAE